MGRKNRMYGEEPELQAQNSPSCVVTERERKSFDSKRSQG